MDFDLDLALQYLLLTLGVFRGRVIPIEPAVEAPLLIYTDAATEAPCPSGLRCGAVVYSPRGTFCMSFDVPEFLVAFWKQRKTYIIMAELLVVPVVAVAAPWLLAHQDVIWFVDNQAALCSIVKSGSTARDQAELALLTNLAMAAAEARVWFEYVPTIGRSRHVLALHSRGCAQGPLRVPQGHHRQPPTRPLTTARGSADNRPGLH